MFALFWSQVAARAIYYLLALTTSYLLLSIIFITPVNAINPNQIEVLAVVRPIRQIVVNRNGQIEKIISNTSNNIRPSVWLKSVGNKRLNINNRIENQYQSILRNLNTNKTYGVIYVRSNKSDLSEAGHLLSKIPKLTILSALLEKI